MVTTELAARGLDAPLVSHVINLDLPTDVQHYIHRAGRVGRAGRPGIVVSFATAEKAFVMRKIAKTLAFHLHDVRIHSNKLIIEA